MSPKNKIINGDYMNRFLEWFYEDNTPKLIRRINEFAKKYNLQIISITTDENQHGAIVLFEGEEPKYRW